jgi:hypothetical protein
MATSDCNCINVHVFVRCHTWLQSNYCTGLHVEIHTRLHACLHVSFVHIHVSIHAISCTGRLSYMLRAFEHVFLLHACSYRGTPSHRINVMSGSQFIRLSASNHAIMLAYKCCLHTCSYTAAFQQAFCSIITHVNVQGSRTCFCAQLHTYLQLPAYTSSCFQASVNISLHTSVLACTFIIANIYATIQISNLTCVCVGWSNVHACWCNVHCIFHTFL